MLHKTRGIVLRTTKYGDASVIVKIYTEQFGVQSYIVNSVRSIKGKGKASLYQHGHLLDLVVYYKDQGNIFRISECQFAHVYQEIPFQVVKGAMLLFYVEVLNKVLPEHDPNLSLFDFVFSSLIDLDQTDRPLANHSLWFLLGLCKYLGFYPEVGGGKYFDLREGACTDTMPAYTDFLSEQQTQALRSCLEPQLRNYDQLTLTPAQRRPLLHQMLRYYQLHLSGFGSVRSIDVLESLFHT